LWYYGGAAYISGIGVEFSRNLFSGCSSGSYNEGDALCCLCMYVFTVHACAQDCRTNGLGTCFAMHVFSGGRHEANETTVFH